MSKSKYTLHEVDGVLESIEYNGDIIWDYTDQMDTEYLSDATTQVLIEIKNHEPMLYDYIVHYVTHFGNKAR